MKTVLATLISAAMLVIVAGIIFVYAGAFNVAATEPHWGVTYWIMEKARMRSIQVHAAGLSPPAGYDDQAKVVGAVGHFSEHCATCHGAPGTPRGDVAAGMYPQPPELTKAAVRYTPGELFWILKNGIKMSGMPSMASDGDDMLWSTVAFLQKLPKLSNDEYNDLWMQSQTHGSTNMDGMPAISKGAGDRGSMNMGKANGQQPAGASNSERTQPAPPSSGTK